MSGKSQGLVGFSRDTDLPRNSCVAVSCTKAWETRRSRRTTCSLDWTCLMRRTRGHVHVLAGGLQVKARVQHPQVKPRKDRQGWPWVFRYWADEIGPDGCMTTVRKYQAVGPSKGKGAITKKEAEIARDRFLSKVNAPSTDVAVKQIASTCSASSIFSVDDNYFSRCLTWIVTGGNERELVEAVFLRERRGGGKVGNLPLVFQFSIRFDVGLLGMWESRSDFQGLWKAGCAFHQSVISTGNRYSAGDSAFAFLACSTR